MICVFFIVFAMFFLYKIIYVMVFMFLCDVVQILLYMSTFAHTRLYTFFVFWNVCALPCMYLCVQILLRIGAGVAQRSPRHQCAQTFCAVLYWFVCTGQWFCLFFPVLCFRWRHGLFCFRAKGLLVGFCVDVGGCGRWAQKSTLEPRCRACPQVVLTG